MSTLSIHPVDYIKLHYHLDVWNQATRLMKLLREGLESSFEGASLLFRTLVVLFSATLVFLSLMQSFQALSIIASYHAAISQVVLTP